MLCRNKFWTIWISSTLDKLRFVSVQLYKKTLESEPRRFSVVALNQRSNATESVKIKDYNFLINLMLWQFM